MRAGHFARRALLAVFALAAPAVSPAQQTTGQHAPEPGLQAIGPRPAPPIRFEDDFSAPANPLADAVDPARWVRWRGVALVVDLDARSQPTALLLEGEPDTVLTSRPIDLGDDAAVKVSFYAAPVEHRAGGALVVECVWADGALTLVEAASRRESDGYELYVAALPAEALRRDVQLRFSLRGEADWLIDDVRLFAARISLLVQGGASALDVHPADIEGQAGGQPPFVRYYDAPAVISVTAPLRNGRRAFQRWLLDGACVGDVDGRAIEQIVADAVALADYALLGDMNGDGRVDQFDLDAFVLAMIDPQTYAERHPELDRLRRSDFNGDGLLNRGDIDQFVDALLEP
ncbi:MAG TPA: hypothetical protein PKC49_10805 [Phycisphaerae bacterium]|nr:hypothetical protein [Phycisphaerae bacterium]